MATPFRPGEIVCGPDFAGRRALVTRVRQAMWSRKRLLLTGVRHQGKRSLVEEAFLPLARRGAILLRVNLWTVEHPSEILRRWVAAVPSDWRHRSRLLDFLREAGLPPETRREGAAGPVARGVGPGPPGPIRLRVRAGMLRPGEAEEQLLGLMKWLDKLSANYPVPTVLALDEVQRLPEIAPEAPALLGRLMATSPNTAWILSASNPLLLRRLTDRRGVLRDVEAEEVGPLSDAEVTPWMDRRLRAHGVRPEDGALKHLLHRAGPRTGDRILLARSAYLRALPTSRLSASSVQDAFQELVREGGRGYEHLWQELAPYQRAVVRALAAGVERLHSRDAAFEHDLPVSSAVSKAIRILREKGHFSPDGPLTFLDPFLREWVRKHAMAEGAGVVETGEDGEVER